MNRVRMQLWNIFEMCDVDGGFGDAIETDHYICTVRCTQSEIQDLINKISKPEVYDEPYDALYHNVYYAQEVIFTDLENANETIEKGPGLLLDFVYSEGEDTE